MELFEQLRREYEFCVGTISGVSRKLGVHRRLVREALASAVAAESNSPRRSYPKQFQSLTATLPHEKSRDVTSIVCYRMLRFATSGVDQDFSGSIR